VSNIKRISFPGLNTRLWRIERHTRYTWS